MAEIKHKNKELKKELFIFLMSVYLKYPGNDKESSNSYHKNKEL